MAHVQPEISTSAPETTTKPIALGQYEVWLWTLAMLLVCLLADRGVGGKLFNDSYQYLSMAYNLRTHGEIATSIIEFDTERSKERIPAPATTVAPGYPIAIRVFELTSISPEKAGLLVSIAGMTAVIPFLWLSSGLMGATRNMQRAAVLIWGINTEVVTYATSVLSEGLFIFFLFGGVTLLIYYLKTGEGNREIALPLGMASFALSYCVRYAGLLAIAALVVYVAWRIVFRRERTALWLSSLAGCFAIVSFGMMRNEVISGTWRGGNDLIVHTPIAKVLHDTASIGYHLLLGPSRHIGLSAMIAAVSAVALFFLLRANSKQIASWIWSDTVVLLLLLVGAYVAGMIYLGMTTMIIYNFSTRYFLPILPVVILLGTATAALAWPTYPDVRRRRAAAVLAAVALIAYTGLNIRGIQMYDYRPQHLTMAAYYIEPTQDGTTLLAWVEKNIPAESVVLATDGQASAYAIKRPTISLVSPRMSHGTWDENEVRRTMATFHSRYLITYPGISDDVAPEQRESPFINSLLQGKNPSWLVRAAYNSHVSIFENKEFEQAGGAEAQEQFKSK
ncbi:MAG: hypothetical protein CXZ00_06615 [Acidobacteria bacterium]|nr:MAG: hypothetical protein CXZ00_06615 [Acidobacteriota bacterium]